MTSMGGTERDVSTAQQIDIIYEGLPSDSLDIENHGKHILCMDWSLFKLGAIVSPQHVGSHGAPFQSLFQIPRILDLFLGRWQLCVKTIFSHIICIG